MFAQYFRDQGLPQDRLVVVSPDAGRVKLAKKFAEMLGATSRSSTRSARARRVARHDADRRRRGKVAIISDDLIDSAGTLCNAAQAVADAVPSASSRARRRRVLHPALDKIDESVLERVVVCDTIPVDPLTRPAKIVVLSVAGILAQTIDNVFRTTRSLPSSRVRTSSSRSLARRPATSQEPHHGTRPTRSRGSHGRPLVRRARAPAIGQDPRRAVRRRPRALVILGAD